MRLLVTLLLAVGCISCSGANPHHPLVSPTPPLVPAVSTPTPEPVAPESPPSDEIPLAPYEPDPAAPEEGGYIFNPFDPKFNTPFMPRPMPACPGGT